MHTNAVVDHLVVAGRDLDALRDAFAAAGFDLEYGGEHGNGITHNYVSGFSNGSYVELISKMDFDATSPWWDREIRETSGPASWALVVEDIDNETTRLADEGFDVDGPTSYARDKPDGRRIEWDLTVVGDRMGAPIPFLVEDRTPREWRVPVPDEDERQGVTNGIADVLLGVSDLERWIEPFRKLFGRGEPDRAVIPDLNAEAVAFPDAPATLLAPRGDGFLADRVERFPGRPIGCTFEPDESRAEPASSDLSERIDWFGDDLRWLEVDAPGRFGLLTPS